jgi:hypothetical protein
MNTESYIGLSHTRKLESVVHSVGDQAAGRKLDFCGTIPLEI